MIIVFSFFCCYRDDCCLFLNEIQKFPSLADYWLLLGSDRSGRTRFEIIGDNPLGMIGHLAL